MNHLKQKTVLNVTLLFFILFYTSFLVYILLNADNYLHVQNNISQRYLVFFFIPICFLLLSLISFFIRSIEFKAKFITASISLIVALYISELFLLIYARVKVERYIDSRSKIEVIRDLRAKGISAYPQVHATSFWSGYQGYFKKDIEIKIGGKEILPFSGISGKTIVYCNEGNGYTIYESDEQGFHNPRGLLIGGMVDIAGVGDSHTLGAAVRTNENAMAIIRGRYPHSVNLGVSGAGPLTELAVLREYGQILKPKIVLWFYTESGDLSDFLAEIRYSDILRKYFDDSHFSQDLFNSKEAIDTKVKEVLEKEINYSFIVQEADFSRNEQYRDSFVTEVKSVFTLSRFRKLVLKLYSTRNINAIASLKECVNNAELMNDTDWNNFRKVIVDAKQCVSRWGGRIFFVYIPSFHSAVNPKGAKNHKCSGAYYRDKLISLLTELNISVIDVYPDFVHYPDPLSLYPLRRNGHPNSRGYKIIADKVLNDIDSECKKLKINAFNNYPN